MSLFLLYASVPSLCFCSSPTSISLFLLYVPIPPVDFCSYYVSATDHSLCPLFPLYSPVPPHESPVPILCSCPPVPHHYPHNSCCIVFVYTSAIPCSRLSVAAAAAAFLVLVLNY